MINQLLYIFATRLSTIQGHIVGKIFFLFWLQNAYKNPEMPLKVASGFLVSSHHKSLVSVAGQFIATLQFSLSRLLDQINALMGIEKVSWRSFSFSFLLPVFFSLSLFNNQKSPLRS